MARASALLVGLTGVDPMAYNNWTGTDGCWGCELDVDNMQRILTPLGYQIKTLKTAQATRDAILSSLYRAAETTVAGDIFVFYYSGHGGQQPDYNNEELDGKDETLVAYDREVIDDKIHEALLRFGQGVRVVMISDSCNSGSNYRGIRTIAGAKARSFRPVAAKNSRDVAIKAQLIHMGGCRDGFSSAGYYGGGAFTMALCRAWDGGRFQGSFNELYVKIGQLIEGDQQPQYNEYGPVSDYFHSQRAFAVAIAGPDQGPAELPVLELPATAADLVAAGSTHQYRFTAPKEGRYVIETVGETDLTMALFGPEDLEHPMARDDDSGDSRNPRISTELKAGTYIVHIQHYDTANGTGSYGIRVWR
jgi:metacaspase-1